MIVTIIMCFVCASVACMFGFVVGRCFRASYIDELEHEVAFYDSDNQQLREVLHTALSQMRIMQEDIESVTSSQPSI